MVYDVLRDFLTFPLMVVASAPKTGLPPSIFFYCKDCEKIAAVTRVGSRYVYSCNTCGTKNVAFGTQRSIMSFFHLDEKDFEKTSSEENPDGKIPEPPSTQV